MGHISRTIHVEATPEQVFDLVTNPERLREWQVPAAEVKDITGTPGTVGLGWTTATTFAGRKMENHMSVTAVERPRSFEVKGTGSETGRCAGASSAAGGTDVTIESEYEMPLGFIGDAANKLFVEKSFAESWDKSLAKFKALVEAEARPTSRGGSSPASGRSGRLRGAGAASSTWGVRGARSSGRDDLRLWRIPRAAVIVIPSGRL